MRAQLNCEKTSSSAHPVEGTLISPSGPAARNRGHLLRLEAPATDVLSRELLKRGEHDYIFLFVFFYTYIISVP